MSSSSRRAPRRPRGGVGIGSFIVVALLAGCATATPAPPMTQSPATGASPELQTLIRAVSDDAARRGGIDASRVRVVEASQVMWADGSLGCPAPGRFYTQALVPGYRVQVEAGGQRLDYHANARGEWSLCPADRARPPAGNSRM